jgi:hypothetical protein
VELTLRDRGRVDQHVPRDLLHRAAQRLGHARQHLEAHVRLHSGESAHHEPEGDVEHVVARDAQGGGDRVLGPAAEEQHVLVAGIDLELRVIRRLRPAAQCGCAALRREVRALHQSHAHGRAAPGRPLPRPGHELALGGMGIGQVGLERDPGRRSQELGLVEHVAQERERELLVVVRLHVEDDALGLLAAIGSAVGRREGPAQERAQSLGEHAEGLLPGKQLELGADGGDLDRHAGNVGPRDRLQGAGHAPLGLGFADDRLTELVQVDPHALGGARGEVARQGGLLGGNHHARGLTAHAATHQGDQQPRQSRAEPAEGAQLGTLEATEVAGQLVDVHQVDDLVRRPRSTPRAVHLVREGRGEEPPLAVVEERGKARLGARLVAPGALEGEPLEIGGERSPLLGEIDGIHAAPRQTPESPPDRRDESLAPVVHAAPLALSRIGRLRSRRRSGARARPGDSCRSSRRRA